MKKRIYLLVILLLSYVSSFGETDTAYLGVKIKEGKHWIHKFKVMPFIKIKTRPQMAVWIEDKEGNFLETIYVTDRAGNQSWKKAPGDKKEIIRDEALPVWENKSGVRQDRSLLTDGAAGATPKSEFESIKEINKKYGDIYVFAEINHSTDFNKTYTSKAENGSKYYSGGKNGSGQPSMIYRALIKASDKNKKYFLKLIGNGHPAGKDGKIYNSEGITTAKDIVESIIVEKVN